MTKEIILTLAAEALNASHSLRDFLDENAGELHYEDYDYITELGVELAAYAVILLKKPDERIDWLRSVIKAATETTERLLDTGGRA